MLLWQIVWPVMKDENIKLDFIQFYDFFSNSTRVISRKIKNAKFSAKQFQNGKERPN
jgi:hypothetical protein